MSQPASVLIPLRWTGMEYDAPNRTIAERKLQEETVIREQEVRGTGGERLNWRFARESLGYTEY